MNSQTIHPLFNAEEARFLSNNQKLFEELVSELDGNILAREKSSETGVHYSISLLGRKSPIDFESFQVDHAKVVLIQALSTFYADRGYDVYNVTNSQFSLNWQSAKDGTFASMSRLRAQEWKHLYKQLELIKLDVLAVATSPENLKNEENKNKITTSVRYRPHLDQAEQADHIKGLLNGYESAGYDVFEMATEERHEIIISW